MTHFSTVFANTNRIVMEIAVFVVQPSISEVFVIQVAVFVVVAFNSVVVIIIIIIIFVVVFLDNVSLIVVSRHQYKTQIQFRSFGFPGKVAHLTLDLQ